MRRILVMGAACASLVLSGLTLAAPAYSQPAPAPLSAKSSPPDRTVYSRPVTAGERRFSASSLATTGVATIDPSQSAATGGGSEPSIAINPANPKQIAITRFSASWNSNADLLYSNDGGITWTEETTIPVPPGVSGAAGCPCDQTLDYGRDGRLYGTFLTNSSVVSGSTADPTQASSWSWNGNPAQLTDASGTSPDQPWLLVNRDPTTATQDNVYVGYDDFNGSPDARVAVSKGANPVNITVDNKAGTESPSVTNPGLRLATDPRNGAVYALYEQSSGGSEPRSVTYKLNRTTNAGTSWTLNGSSDGLTVATVNSDQAPGYKFAGVNALLGGVDHAAVDPTNGDVYVVYGQDSSGNNQIMIRRLTDNGSGGLNVGSASAVSTSTDTALPSVAVLADHTIGVLYITHDGTNSGGFPTFSAHLARSTDQGATFRDVVLESFASPALPSGTVTDRQRIFGDYDQIKAVGNAFYGVFSGNATGFGSATSQIDPIFFSVPQATNMTLTSSVNPSVFGQAVHFTAQVAPVPDGGNVNFTVDGNPLGGNVAVNTTTGTAVSPDISTLAPGMHNVVANYGGDANFVAAMASLTQTVTKAATTTVVTSNFNPSVFGQPVTLTATVTANAPGSGTPTGNVQFFDNGTPIGSGSLVAGKFSIIVSSLTVGSHPITASYGGDTDFMASNSAVFNQVVNKAPTTTTLTANPPGSVGFGHPVTFTAQVAPAPPSTNPPALPTGQVVFSVDGTPVQTVTIDASQRASVTTSALSPGSHLIGAAYSGDGNFLGSTGTLTYLVTCTVTVSGNHPGGLIASGDSTCVVNATVGGAIVVPKGTSLAVINSTVNGSINATNMANAIEVCGSHFVGGSVSVINAQGLVIVGDPGDANCAVNTITGTLLLDNNTHGVEAIGNTVGNLVASGNTGPGPYPGDVTTISGNIISH